MSKFIDLAIMAALYPILRAAEITMGSKSKDANYVVQ